MFNVALEEAKEMDVDMFVHNSKEIWRLTTRCSQDRQRLPKIT